MSDLSMAIVPAGPPAAAGPPPTTVAIGPGKPGVTRKLEVDGDVLEVTPLGAGSEVGRSCCLLRFRGKVVMFDCGIHPAHSGMSTLPYFDHINPSEVDVVLVTHFHLDHSGSVPYFVNKTEFKGKVYMTHPTRPICRLLWHDYARISKISGEDQIFSSEDIEESLDAIELMDYHEERQHKGIKFTAYRAGHVLGAAMFVVDIGGYRVLYTGDYSREVDRHLPQAEIPLGKVQVLIVESTYGIQNHEPREQRERRFTNSVHEIVKQGGKCLLPVFALGRAQELLLILEDYWERNPDLHEIPIYYNSPMATKCLRIFETYTNMCSETVQEQANRCSNPWKLKYVKNMPDRHQFQESDTDACVVLAAPGMMQSGASRKLFEQWAPDKRNGIIVTGYSVRGTLAHELKSEPQTVLLNDGVKVNVQATIKFISFSAHSDYNQTSDFIQQLKANVVVLVHGEEHEMARMQNKLKYEYPALNVSKPQNCQSISFSVAVDRGAEAVGSLVEEISDVKRSRKEVSGLVVEEPGGSRLLLKPEELAQHTTLSACAVQQCQRFTFSHPLALLARAVRETFDEISIEKDHFVVCDCVVVTLVRQTLSISWDASPVADLVADSVCMAAVELTRCPPPVQAVLGQEDPSSQEDRLFKVLCTFLQQEFGRITVDDAEKKLEIEVDDLLVGIDFPTRSVRCESEGMAERVRTCLRRCETALRPLAPF